MDFDNSNWYLDIDTNKNIESQYKNQKKLDAIPFPKRSMDVYKSASKQYDMAGVQTFGPGAQNQQKSKKRKRHGH